MFHGLSVNPTSRRVIMYIKLVVFAGARHFPSRRAIVCDVPSRHSLQKGSKRLRKGYKRGNIPQSGSKSQNYLSPTFLSNPSLIHIFNSACSNAVSFLYPCQKVALRQSCNDGMLFSILNNLSMGHDNNIIDLF